MKIVLNDDNALVLNIRKGLEKTGGYCPCSLVKDDSTKCMCKEFREMNTPGICHCGLYKKVDD